MSDTFCCGIEFVGQFPDGAVPMEAIAVVKVPSFGDMSTCRLATPSSPRYWEVVGMVDLLDRITRRAIAET